MAIINGQVISIAPEAVTPKLIRLESTVVDSDEAKLPSASSYWYTLVYGNGTYVAFDVNSRYFAYSYDAVNWEWGDLGDERNGMWGYGTSAYGNGIFVAMNPNDKYAGYSYDGITWTETSLPNVRTYEPLCFGAGKFVALSGQSGGTNVIYSTDGITWNITTLSTGAYWTGVAYGNDKFVGIARNTDACIYSSDGVTWSYSKMPSSTSWGNITCGNGMFVATAAGTTAAYSLDGITWTATNLPSGFTGTAKLCYGNGVFVALGTSSVAYSTNGISWKMATLPASEDWYGLIHDGKKFVGIAYQSDIVIMSPDGVNWGSSVETNLVDERGNDVTNEVRDALEIDDVSLPITSNPTDDMEMWIDPSIDNAEGADFADVDHNHDEDYDVKGAAAAVQANLDTHANNLEIHITAEERNKWNDKADAGHNHDGVYAPMYTYSTTDLTAGTSPLDTGRLYFVYE